MVAIIGYFDLWNVVEVKYVIKSYNIEKGTSGVWKTLTLSTNHISPSMHIIILATRIKLNISSKTFSNIFSIYLGSLQWHRGMIYLINRDGSIYIITKDAIMQDFLQIPLDVETVIPYYV